MHIKNICILIVAVNITGRSSEPVPWKNWEVGWSLIINRRLAVDIFILRDAVESRKRPEQSVLNLESFILNVLYAPLIKIFYLLEKILTW